MKNRVLLMAAAAALALPGVAKMPGAQVQLTPPNAPQGAGGTQSPQGGIGSLFDAFRSGGNAGAGFHRPKYQKERGPGHLAAKRLKRKRRNKLRAKGQFRKAVR